jgi:preprotein translocase subunit SecB
MAPKKKHAHSDAGVRLSAPELWRLEFTRNELIQDFKGEAPPLLFGLGLNRLANNKIGVELSVEIKDFPPVSMTVSYRAVFELDRADSKGESFEKELKFVAAKLAPTALYPFLRETVAITLVKAGLPPLIAPVVNFASVFDADEVVLPPMSES